MQAFISTLLRRPLVRFGAVTLCVLTVLAAAVPLLSP
jgi:hypothetical protein